jgi:hypothetical protein
VGMAMRLAALVLALACLGCAHTPDPWTPEQKVLFGAFTALHTVDLMQTQYIFDSDKYDEMNPIIRKAHDQGGGAAVAGYFIGTWAVVGGVAHYLPSPYRTAWLSTFSLVQLGFVLHNNHIGCGLGKPF